MGVPERNRPLPQMLGGEVVVGIEERGQITPPGGHPGFGEEDAPEEADRDQGQQPRRGDDFGDEAPARVGHAPTTNNDVEAKPEQGQAGQDKN